MKIRTAILLLFISASSCRPVIFLLTGGHPPRPENKESLIKYLDKKKINSDNILVFSDSLGWHKRIKKLHRDLPGIRIFNGKGSLVYYKDTSSACTGPAYVYTDSICTYSSPYLNSSQRIEDELKGLLTLENMPVTFSEKDEYDYYVFIYWARFLGRFNKNHVRVWENNLKKAKGCRVKIYKVDMDLQKRWHLK